MPSRLGSEILKKLPDIDFDFDLRVPTYGGAQFWADVHWRSNWRIQRNAFNDYYRLLDPKNRWVEGGTRAECEAALALENPPPNPEQLTMFIHGLFSTWRFCQPFAKMFQKNGLETGFISYPTTRADLATHGAGVAEVVAGLDGVKRLNVVTHSMGGLVLSNAVRQAAWPDESPLKKVVMLCPPIRGAAMARLFSQVKLLHPIVGPPLTFLQAPKEAPDLPEDVDLLVIAGTRGDPRGFNPLLKGDDDGTVAVYETRPRRRHEFATVRAQHTLIRNSKRAQNIALNFLRI